MNRWGTVHQGSVHVPWVSAWVMGHATERCDIGRTERSSLTWGLKFESSKLVLFTLCFPMSISVAAKQVQGLAT